MTRWRITFTNGDTELTPDTVDNLRADFNDALLYARASRTYGRAEVIATYPLANVRKWERVNT